MTNTFEIITDRTLAEISETSLEEILVEIQCELGHRREEKKKEYYERFDKLVSEILDGGYDVYYNGQVFENVELEIM